MSAQDAASTRSVRDDAATMATNDEELARPAQTDARIVVNSPAAAVQGGNLTVPSHRILTQSLSEPLLTAEERGRLRLLLDLMALVKKGTHVNNGEILALYLAWTEYVASS